MAGVADHHGIDRLWPDPAPGLALEAVAADLWRTPPVPFADRPWVATNMVTSIDGRAQLGGTADGIGSRIDRRLMQLYRSVFDAVVSGSGSLMADDFYSRLPDSFAIDRQASGRAPQPIAVVVAGVRPVPTDRRWFTYEDQLRVIAVGRASPHAHGTPLRGVETWVAPTDHPDPSWLLGRLADRGVRSVLLEGGPTLNAAFLADGALDEVFWTIGPLVLTNDALPMMAPSDRGPVGARLVSVHRAGDELFARYQLPRGEEVPAPHE